MIISTTPRMTEPKPSIVLACQICNEEYSIQSGKWNNYLYCSDHCSQERYKQQLDITWYDD